MVADFVCLLSQRLLLGLTSKRAPDDSPAVEATDVKRESSTDGAAPKKEGDDEAADERRRLKKQLDKLRWRRKQVGELLLGSKRWISFLTPFLSI
jgi:hypothetical protein